MACGNRGEILKSLLKQAVDVFKQKIEAVNSPEVAVFAPGRVNLIGEHTDYNNGLVLPMAIDQVTVMVGSRRTSSGADNTCRLITLSPDLGQSDVTIPLPMPPTIEQYKDKNARIDRANKTWYRYVVGVVALMNMKADGSPIGIPPFDVVIATNVPLGGGLSSSAALEVATYYFIEAICKKASVALVQRNPQERALLCQRAEHLYANAPCGIMDQFVCVLAQESTACYIDCCPTVDGAYLSENVPLKIGEKGLVIMIANCKVKHEVSDGGYELRRDRCYEAAKIMGKASLREATEKDIEDHRDKLSVAVDKGPSLYQCALHVVQEIARTIQAKQVLTEGNYKEFGRLMNDSHTSLKDHYLVSCAELDKLVELVRQDRERVLGSRMTGAGFGGCTVTLLEESAVGDAVRRMQEGYYSPNNITPEYYIVSPCSGGSTVNLDQYL